MNRKENDKEAAQIDHFIKYAAVGIGLVTAMIGSAGNSVAAALVCIVAGIFYHRSRFSLIGKEML